MGKPVFPSNLAAGGKSLKVSLLMLYFLLVFCFLFDVLFPAGLAEPE